MAFLRSSALQALILLSAIGGQGEGFGLGPEALANLRGLASSTFERMQADAAARFELTRVTPVGALGLGSQGLPLRDPRLGRKVDEADEFFDGGVHGLRQRRSLMEDLVYDDDLESEGPMDLDVKIGAVGSSGPEAPDSSELSHASATSAPPLFQAPVAQLPPFLKFFVQPSAPPPGSAPESESLPQLQSSEEIESSSPALLDGEGIETYQPDTFYSSSHRHPVNLTSLAPETLEALPLPSRIAVPEGYDGSSARIPNGDDGQSSMDLKTGGDLDSSTRILKTEADAAREKLREDRQRAEALKFAEWAEANLPRAGELGTHPFTPIPHFYSVVEELAWRVDRASGGTFSNAREEFNRGVQNGVDWVLNQPEVMQLRLLPGDHLRVKGVAGFVALTHHAIYLGDGKIMHFTGGVTDKVNATCKTDTLRALVKYGGSRGLKVEVIPHPEQALERDVIVERAMTRVGETGYNLFSNNCEHVVNWCITGENRSQQVETFAADPLGKVQDILQEQALAGQPLDVAEVARTILPAPVLMPFAGMGDLGEKGKEIKEKLLEQLGIKEKDLPWPLSLLQQRKRSPVENALEGVGNFWSGMFKGSNPQPAPAA